MEMRQPDKILRRYAPGGLAAVLVVSAQAQLGWFTTEQRVEFTKAWKGERFADGRPKVPDSVLKRMKDVSAEEAWAVIYKAGFKDHFEAGWQHVAFGTKERLVGRAVTAVFMPIRPDVNDVILEHAQAEHRAGKFGNSWVIDTLVPGDVIVADERGYNFMGDNLATSIYSKSKTGVVIDGTARDLSGISEIEGFQAYLRGWHPSTITHGIYNVMLTGLNVPVRIGETTVMPGDVVLGDPEGVVFVPAILAEKVVDYADDIHLRDEWSHAMLKTGKYSPGQLDTPKWAPEIEADFQKWAAEQKRKK